MKPALRVPAAAHVRHVVRPALRERPVSYTVGLATNTHDFRAALRLRYEVFNLELREGLQSSDSTGHDFDHFDSVVDHIVVKCAYSGSVIGTYRLQTGLNAARHMGYYSQQEFNFTPYEQMRSQILELGRACIHHEHRNTQVLMLLWKAIVQYGVQRGCRYLIGCSSVTTQDPALGAAIHTKLQKFLAPAELQTRPQQQYLCPLDSSSDPQSEEVKIPKLLRAYLTIGAYVCGPPALDREFRTIDFLTLLDLARLPKGLFGRVSDEAA